MTYAIGYGNPLSSKFKIVWFTTIKAARAWAIKNYKKALYIKKTEKYSHLIHFISKDGKTDYTVGQVNVSIHPYRDIEYTGWDHARKVNFKYLLNNKGEIISKNLDGRR